MLIHQLFCHNPGIYINKHMQVTKHLLFHARLPLYDLFLYSSDLRH